MKTLEEFKLPASIVSNQLNVMEYVCFKFLKFQGAFDWSGLLGPDFCAALPLALEARQLV